MAQRTLQSRLDRVLRETGWTPADLTRVTQADASTVSHWLNGKNKGLDSVYAFRIQDVVTSFVSCRP